MIDLEFVLDEIDVLKSKLEWAQIEISGNIKLLKASLDNYENIKKDIDDFSLKTRSKLL